MPGTLLPRFVRVGGFWVADEWRVRADAVDAMKKCPTRRRILRDAPPIDNESLPELGEFVPHDPDQAQDSHVRVAGTDFVYAPELRVCDCTGGGRVADFAAVDLVMTNYNLARGMTGVDFETGGTVVGALVQATWGLLVLDEFSVVANPGTSSFHSVAAIRAQAKRVLLLNATMLENTTVDLWAHLELVSPGTYGTADLFAGFDRMLLSGGDAFEAASDRVRRDVFAYTVDEKQCSAADLSIPPLI